MAKTDWNLHDTVLPEDMNELGSEINKQGTGLSKLEDRLNIAEYEDITLQPGLQVINAKRDSRFRLGEIKGRTLINLLGSTGDCELTSEWAAGSSTLGSLKIDNILKDSGNSSLKYTQVNNGNGYVRSIKPCPFDSTKYLVAIAWVKNTTGNTLGCRFVANSGTAIPSANTKALAPGKTGLVYWASTPSELGGNSETRVDIYSPNSLGAGEYFNYDSVRVYNITQTEYAALNSLTDNEINEKYPFVTSGIIGVDNPYAIGYGENLLPPFYEWGVEGSPIVNGAYAGTVSSSNKFIMANFSVIPGKTYSFSAQSSGATGRIVALGSSGILADVVGVGIISITFTVPVGTSLIELRILSTDATNVLIKSPMLTLGPEPKTFKPRRDTMLALQMDLHANPVGGEDPDVLFEKEGQYFKLAKWKKVVLDGALPWEFHNADTGYKIVRVTGGRISGFSDSSSTNKFVTKYNGVKLPWIDASNEEGAFWNDMNFIGGSFLVVALNKDSGWGEAAGLNEFSGNGSTVKFTIPAVSGLQLIPSTVSARVDNTSIAVTSVNGYEITVATAPATGEKLVVNYKVAYVPTVDEIKAYFMGWRMYNYSTGDTIGTYNGTGVKGWFYYDKATGNTTGGTTTVPVSAPVNNLRGPYQLLYRLAKEIVEPVVSEVSLRLHEGDNLVEVGTGILLREKTNPALTPPTTDYYINKWDFSGTLLKNKTRKIVRIFRDNVTDPNWTIQNTPTDTVGNMQRALISYSKFDQSATYTVTYLRLDNSPFQPITGTLAANEKAQSIDLTAGVAEALQRFSVVEQKEKDKDAPGWITPTLLNGWIPYGSGTTAPGYYKDSDGYVHMKGLIKSGIANLPILYLPLGYRPKEQLNFSVLTTGTGGLVIGQLSVNITGSLIANGGTLMLSLDGITFLAEQ